MSALGKDIQGGRQEKVINREVLKGVGCSGNGDVNSVPSGPGTWRVVTGC